MISMDFEKELNPEQYKAVTQKDGPLLILAGAGSGKTRVITYRVAYLIGHYGVSPYNILAITFTNKAAREMRERVERMLGDEGRGVFISTFHRFCGRLLRDRGELIGYSSTFAVYDEKDTEKVIKDCLKELDIDSKSENPGLFRASISKLKNQMVTPDYYQEIMDKSNPWERKLLKVFRLYNNKLFENNAMDFDDMLLKAVELLEKNPEVCDFYARRYRYIMVDEYQDTNKVQYKLVKLLSPHGNLCVVGDDDQSIYSFRGADIENILSFEKGFPGCTVIKLEQNYRSTEHILSAANSVIAGNNGVRKQKKLWTAKKGGRKIAKFIGENQMDESRFVAGEISRLVDSGEYGYNDIAVLYRQNALSQYLESEFVRRGIPLRVYGGVRFFERAEIKVLVNYLRLIENPGDVNAFAAIVNVPKRSVGEKGVETVIELSRSENLTPMEILAGIGKYPGLSRYATALKEFSDAYENLRAELRDYEIPDFIEKVLNETGLLAYYGASDLEKDEDRCGNLREMLTVAREYVASLDSDPTLENSLAGFLQNISLSTDMDNEEEGDEHCVTLMTVHSAKGLEFPVVFVVAMEEGMFPSTKALDEGNVDEERRLCYVAITRAKERLYLTYAKERMIYGQTRYNPRSEFLDGIPAENSMTVNYLGEEVSEKEPGRRYGGYPRYNSDSDYLTYGNSENQGYGYRGRSGYYNGTYGSGYGNRRKPSYKDSDDDLDLFGDDSGSGYGNGSSRGYGSSGSSGSFGFSGKGFSGSGSSFSGRSGSANTSSGGNGPSTMSEKLAAAKLAAKAGDKDIHVGDRVEHPKYGEGLVTSVEGDYTGDKDDRICEITFENHGMKRFAMQYTKLKKL